MKILQITSDYVPRPLWGMGWHVKQIVSGFSEISDSEVYVATASKSSKEGINMICTDVETDRKLLSDNPYEIFNDFENFNKWQLALAKNILNSGKKFDIIHAHNWMSWLTAKEVKKYMPDAKIYITFHLLQRQYELMKDNPIPSHHDEIVEIEQEAINLADGVVILSDSQINLLESHYDIDSKKMHLIPHSINFILKDFSTLKVLKKKSNVVRLVFLGRVEEDKGIREVLEVFKLLCGQYELSLDVIGDGPILKDLKEKYLNGNIKFWGYLDRVSIESILQDSHMFCMPSSSENLPLTVLEAMGFGLVPVFTSGSSVPHIYDHDYHGKLIKLIDRGGKLVPDKEQLLLEIEDLLKNPEKITKMSERSYKLISKKYSVRKMIESLIDLYGNKLQD